MRIPECRGTMPQAPLRRPFRVIPRRSFLGFILLSAARPSLAMYSPEDIAAARRTAAFHLEVRMLKMEPTRTQPGQAWVTGEVTQVYRTDGRVKPGATLGFWVDTTRRGLRSPPGDDVRLELEELLPGRWLEGYFASSAKEGELAVALRQIGIFAASSTTPRL